MEDLKLELDIIVKKLITKSFILSLYRFEYFFTYFKLLYIDIWYYNNAS
jgi:hypothetical protein